MENRNDKKKKFFLKRYLRPIPELKDVNGEFDSKVVVERNMGFNTLEVVVIIIISILFGFVVGCILNSNKGSFIGKKVSPEILEFVDTYDNILNNYYGEIDKKELMDAAVSGMVQSLDDPYSSFMDASTTYDFNKTIDGEYVGIGITVMWQEGKTIVIDVFDDSPAKKAGALVDDVIVKVGKKDITALSFDEISELLKGEKGTSVNIVVLRDGKEVSLKIKRGNIVISSVHDRVIENNGKKVGYIYIDNFAANTAKQFREKLKKLESLNIDSLILDVRGNPGGHLNQVATILDMFLDKKTVLYQIETKNKKQKYYSVTKEKRNYPVAVIVDSSSASASEILAASFQDSYKNSTIVGEVTYGKGTIQNALNLSSGVSLKYTTQKWLTSKGKWLDGIGIVPDIEIEQNEAYCSNPSQENDYQLQKALEILTQKESK